MYRITVRWVTADHRQTGEAQTANLADAIQLILLHQRRGEEVGWRIAFDTDRCIGYAFGFFLLGGIFGAAVGLMVGRSA